MKASAQVQTPLQSVRAPLGVRQVLQFARRIPARLGEHEFWLVQALVLLVTGLHYGVEAQGTSSPVGMLHDVVITLYILPLLYAALTFGWEGAFMTALGAVVLTAPGTWLWHRSDERRLTEVVHLGISLFVGGLVAWRVDREARERLRAQKTSANLGLLKAVAEGLSHSLEVEHRLPSVVHQLREGLALGSLWLSLEPETSDGEPLIIQDGDPAFLSTAHSQSDSADPVETGGTIGQIRRTISVSLVGEAGTLGLLLAEPAGVAAINEDQVELLTVAGREISAAVENARLYRQRQESLQAYVRQVTQAQEEERLRIARELHDETAQDLVHLVRKLDELVGEAVAPHALSAQSALEVARGILRSVRRFSRNLRPSVLDDLGLLAALEMVADDAQGGLIGGAHLQITGVPRRLEPQVELALFRIAQEALRNVEKHAKATTATIDLCFGEERICLTVTDDGVGFSPPRNVSDLVRLGKLGLIGIKERAESIGGSLELLPVDGHGLRLVVCAEHDRIRSHVGPSSGDCAPDQANSRALPGVPR